MLKAPLNLGVSTTFFLHQSHRVAPCAAAFNKLSSEVRCNLQSGINEINLQGQCTANPLILGHASLCNVSVMQTSHPALAGLLTDFLTSFNVFFSQIWQNSMALRLRDLLVLGTLSREVVAQCSQSSGPVDLGWHAPNATNINNLGAVVNGTGVDGFIFNTSTTPSTSAYSTYNWCNMPHVRRQEYVKPPADYKLEYVELVCPVLLVALVDCALTEPRFIDIISGLHMHQTHFHTRHMPGIATTRRCSTLALLAPMALQLR